MKGVEKVLSVIKSRKDLRRKERFEKGINPPHWLILYMYFVSITLFIFPGRQCILNIE